MAGVFDVECTVICGTTHSYMLSKVHVIPPELFDAWAASPMREPPGPEGVVVAKGGPVDPVAHGKALAEEKGCTGCHSDDGSELVGPTFKGLWGKRETLEGGKTVLVDEKYVARSIKDPDDEIVTGYPNAMPEEPVTDAEIQDLIAWLKTLR
jgi:cytochrome c oxidase subunit 2